MKPQTVDLALIVDASESMQPCFCQLREHLKDLLQPLQQASFRVRFGLVAHAAAPGRKGPVYDHTFIGGSGPEMIRKLYGPVPDPGDFFTNDPGVVGRVLDGLAAQGNEDSLVALDIAADLPFGPAETTRRVIAMFTDEPLEDGVAGNEPLAMLPELVKKLTARRIQLFVCAPVSEALEELGTLDKAEIEAVDGGDGLRKVHFGKLMAQMGKSISVSTLQAGPEPTWRKALFGQNRWDAQRSVTGANRRVVLAVGETARLDTTKPITRVSVKLKWTTPVDLDLHAFCRMRDGTEKHVYFADRFAQDIELDFDAGIGDVGGKNEENITIGSLKNIEEVLFATKIFNKGGCYADYDGRVTVQTNNGDEVVVPLTSQERADWCVIAKINTNQNGTIVSNLNKVTDTDPSPRDF
jgi:uncharacterized protein involved in tellurium resistance